MLSLCKTYRASQPSLETYNKPVWSHPLPVCPLTFQHHRLEDSTQPRKTQHPPNRLHDQRWILEMHRYWKIWRQLRAQRGVNWLIFSWAGRTELMLQKMHCCIIYFTDIWIWKIWRTCFQLFSCYNVQLVTTCFCSLLNLPAAVAALSNHTLVLSSFQK